VREQFLKRLASEIKQRGALDVLRNGIRDSALNRYFSSGKGSKQSTKASFSFAAGRGLSGFLLKAPGNTSARAFPPRHLRASPIQRLNEICDAD
jgi:hypothetical protein